MPPESNKAQSRDVPKPAPAFMQAVTVPGPIKAAATNVAGPIFLKGFCMGLNDRPKVIKLTEFLVYLQFPFNDGLHFWCCKST